MASTREPANSPRASLGPAVALLIVCGVCYLLMLLALNAGPGGDPSAGGGETRIAQAIAAFYALAFGVPLWIALGGLLFLPGARKDLSARAVTITGLLYPLAAIAALVGANNYLDAPGGWSILVPAGLPLLIAAHSVWLQIPRLRRPLRVETAIALGLGAIAVLSAAVAPLTWLDRLEAPARLARYQLKQDALFAKQQAEQAQLEAEIDAKHKALTSDSPLIDHLEYVYWTSPNSPERETALAGARRAKNRQADAIKLLNDGKLVWLEDMPLLDLQATPALCAAYDAALVRKANDTEQFDNNVGEALEGQLPNIKFLVGAHCNLDSGLDAAIARIGVILGKIGPEDGARPGWSEFRAALAAQRQAK